MNVSSENAVGTRMYSKPTRSCVQPGGACHHSTLTHGKALPPTRTASSCEMLCKSIIPQDNADQIANRSSRGAFCGLLRASSPCRQSWSLVRHGLAPASAVPPRRYRTWSATSARRRATSSLLKEKDRDRSVEKKNVTGWKSHVAQWFVKGVFWTWGPPQGSQKGRVHWSN